MTMARKEFTITDDEGNVQPGASVLVQHEAPGAPIAALYEDRAGSVPLSNPFFADADGVAAFHSRGGAYRITITKGAFTRVLRFVPIGLAQESDDSLNVDPQSAWNSVDTFNRNMIVSDQGAAWIAKRENTNAPPPTLPAVENDDWLLLSAPGAGIVGSALQLDQIATPSPPSAGRNLLYFKGDEKLYKQTSGGVETEIGAGGSYPPGFLFGLGTGPNGSNPTTEIDVQAGRCRDSTDGVDQSMAALYTISLAAFDESGKGSLDTGSVGNNSYFIHIISGEGKATRPLTSLSPTAPTMPSGYTHFRRIAAIMRESGSIVPYTQLGNTFLKDNPGTPDVTANNPSLSATLRTVKVPVGISVDALIRWRLNNSSAGVFFGGNLTSPLIPALSPAGANNTVNLPTSRNEAGYPQNAYGETRVMTNTSAQVRTQFSGADANCTLYLSAVEWIDRRGQDGGA